MTMQDSGEKYSKSL